MYSEQLIEMEHHLNLDTLKIAKKELREDEETRNNALSQMRFWLKKNNKIIYSRSGKYCFFFFYYVYHAYILFIKTVNILFFFFTFEDDSFLLRFLRTKKFSLPLTQEALERYLLLRQTFGRQLFYKLDITCSRLEQLLTLG